MKFLDQAKVYLRAGDGGDGENRDGDEDRAIALPQAEIAFLLEFLVDLLEEQFFLAVDFAPLLLALAGCFRGLAGGFRRCLGRARQRSCPLDQAGPGGRFVYGGHI